MNTISQTNLQRIFFSRLIKWPALCLLLALARPALAADSGFTNDAIVDYTSNLPIDATNFVNNGSITINAPYFNLPAETYDTVNYINTGMMSSDLGFWFDTQNSLDGNLPRSMAGSFSNSGEVDNGSQFYAWATNIVNGGTVNVGENGLMRFTGQNLDLSRSTLFMGFSGQSGFFSGIFPISGGVGVNTNAWYPQFDLTLPDPISSPPLSEQLINATAYVQAFTNISGAGTNRLVEAVFISNPNPSITNYVFLNPFGIEVEWDGTYVDPASGLEGTNYIYLEDDFGEITNLQTFGGVPVNYFLFQAGPGFFGNNYAPSGLPPNTFGNNAVSNDYAFYNVELSPTTASTNGIANGAITNIAGRIQITATNDLDLNLAEINGANYLSLQSTNQFDGNNGAQIVSPFSDINLGVTNGNLTMTNLLQLVVPRWNGEVQLWSGRWSMFDTNSGMTNVFHVLFVNNALASSSSAQVQDLILHATNNLVISDTFNIMRKLSIDAQSLTLTTNGIGVGAASPDGELNFNSSDIFWASSLPNLLWLTNDGAIRTMNLTYFGFPALPYDVFINNGVVTNLGGSTIYANDFENYGSFSSGINSFTLQSLTTTLTNGSITAGGDISITTGSLVTSNVFFSAGRGLTLSATTELTDDGVTNGNIWSVGGASLVGLNLPVKPLIGDLLGTTITNYAPADNKQTVNTWAGTDYGVSVNGYTNNAAIGRLILDAVGLTSTFRFTGAGASNALYVDLLVLDGALTNGIENSYEFSNWLSINTNLVIYFAQATVDGISVADKINNASKNNGKNGGRLLWVPAYTGYFSSTNFVNPDGTTNTYNAALVASSVDSNGDGHANSSDPAPFFLSSEVDLTLTMTNIPPLTAVIAWHSIPSATNVVCYKTNLNSSAWFTLTNFVSPANTPPVGGWPITNTIYDTINPAQPHYYNVKVYPNTSTLYGQ